MRLVKPDTQILYYTEDAKQIIELAGRTCYKSEDRITGDSAEAFVDRITKSGHHSVIEHASATVKFIVDRGVSHELVRHRLCSFSQESTRYCKYDEVTFVIPPWLKLGEGVYTQVHCSTWVNHLIECEHVYSKLLKSGWSPQQARSILPNALKTEVVMTANLREWRHVFDLRCSKAAHPQMQEVMIPLRDKFKERGLWW
jgi:thymidylate synthase (FAD)